MRAWRFAAGLLGICVGAPVYFVGWLAGELVGAAYRGFRMGHWFWVHQDWSKAVNRD